MYILSLHNYFTIRIPSSAILNRLFTLRLFNFLFVCFITFFSVWTLFNYCMTILITKVHQEKSFKTQIVNFSFRTCEVSFFSCCLPSGDILKTIQITEQPMKYFFILSQKEKLLCSFGQEISKLFFEVNATRLIFKVISIVQKQSMVDVSK